MLLLKPTPQPYLLHPYLQPWLFLLRHVSHSSPFQLVFSSELGCSEQFLHHCSLVFDQQSCIYSTDNGAKIAFVQSLLCDRASQCAVAASKSQALFCQSYPLFSAELLKIFNLPVQGKEILYLNETDSVANFAINFRICGRVGGMRQNLGYVSTGISG